MFFFADPAVERVAKRFVRDRLRYLDVVYCAAGEYLEFVMEVSQ